jgi:hypothetical protein
MGRVISGIRRTLMAGSWVDLMTLIGSIGRDTRCYSYLVRRRGFSCYVRAFKAKRADPPTTLPTLNSGSHVACIS